MRRKQAETCQCYGPCRHKAPVARGYRIRTYGELPKWGSKDTSIMWLTSPEPALRQFEEAVSRPEVYKAELYRSGRRRKQVVK